MARSLTCSETKVRANMLKIPATVEGMVSRFVLNVLNLYRPEMIEGR